MQAKEEKEKGNTAYKKRNFESAIEHYEKAIELDPTNMTYLTNLAAVKYEQKDYEACIKICEKAVEIGRENRADFKLIAKALTRIGNGYRQTEDYQKAKTYYEKAMSEHRTPETKELLSKVTVDILFWYFNTFFISNFYSHYYLIMNSKELLSKVTVNILFDIFFNTFFQQ